VKKVLTILVSLLIAAPIASAQSVSRQATQADSLLIRHNIYRELFAGITLTPDQRAQAEGVIADADRTSWPTAPFANCADMHKWYNANTETRDSTLLGLLKTAADSAKFAHRAATFIMGPCPPGHL
jgi:hypothetical protein